MIFGQNSKFLQLCNNEVPMGSSGKATVRENVIVCGGSARHVGTMAEISTNSMNNFAKFDRSNLAIIFMAFFFQFLRVSNRERECNFLWWICAPGRHNGRNLIK